MKISFCLFLILLSANLYAENLFTVSPYINVEDQGKLTLNFQTARDMSLDISVTSTNNSIKTKEFTKSWNAKTLNKIDIGTLNCGEGLRYTFSSKKELIESIVDRGLYSIPCDKNQTFSFGFLSDTQIKNASGQVRANELSKAVSEIQTMYPISLIVNAGDIVQHGGLESEWTNFFKTASVYLSGSYLMAAVGNHEYYESPSQDKAPPQFLKYMRTNQSSDLGYMQLDLGRVNLLMLNSNFPFMSPEKVKEQWDWLEDKLATSEALNKPVIVIMHHSAFSSSLEHVREIPTKLRAEFIPIIEKHKNVKMVISGHLHMYERSQKDGITYLIAGPSGGINNVISYPNQYRQFIKALTTTFSVFNVGSDSLEVLTYDASKKVIDQFKVSLK